MTQQLAPESTLMHALAPDSGSSDPSAARVGLIGLGTMGRRIASRLLAGGCRLLIYDRSPEAVARVISAGASATEASAAEAVVAAADVVFTSLPGPDDVSGLYLGPAGVATAVHQGQVLVDLSTIDPTTSRRIAAAVTPAGAAFLDAPVSGGFRGAESGTLTLMVGGDQAALGRVRPLLALFSERVIYVGSAGTGSAVKLANQLLVAANTAAVAEAAAFAVRFGVDAAMLLEVVGTSAGDSRMLRRTLGEFARTRDFAPAFALRLLVKDLRLYLEEAQASGAATPGGDLTLRTYEAALTAGLGDEDYAAILKRFEDAGMPPQGE